MTHLRGIGSSITIHNGPGLCTNDFSSIALPGLHGGSRRSSSGRLAKAFGRRGTSPSTQTCFQHPARRRTNCVDSMRSSPLASLRSRFLLQICVREPRWRSPRGFPDRPRLVDLSCGAGSLFAARGGSDFAPGALRFSGLLERSILNSMRGFLRLMLSVSEGLGFAVVVYVKDEVLHLEFGLSRTMVVQFQILHPLRHWTQTTVMLIALFVRL